MKAIKAIETRYKGYKMRSRLEAKWGVYFDTLGLAWEFEPEGFDLNGLWYLPDFWFPQVSMYGEVKPKQPDSEEIEKAKRLAEASGYPVLLLVGMPDFCSYWAIQPEGEVRDYIISNYHDYPNHEGRFYCMTGMETEKQRAKLLPVSFRGSGFEREVYNAVFAARAARFEFGEKPHA